MRLVRSGDGGVIEGNGVGETLTIRFIDLETVVIPGETVVTSGLEGSEFPAGIVVGTVVAARLPEAFSPSNSTNVPGSSTPAPMMPRGR